jgi:hypothetical protein
MLTFEQKENVVGIADEIVKEVLRAASLHAPMHSPHEADSVIREEYEEFWDEVKAFNLPKGRDTRPAMRAELIQLAAMAIRAISDIIDKPNEVKAYDIPSNPTTQQFPVTNSSTAGQ